MRAVGAGDFDRNGVPEVVWQNNTTGQVVMHYYGGAGGAVDQGYAGLDSGVAGWTVVAAAGMNSDGVQP